MALAVLGVTGSAAVVSYEHAIALVRADGECAHEVAPLDGLRTHQSGSDRVEYGAHHQRKRLNRSR